MYTKMMELVDANLRKSTDLTKYKKEITNAVETVIPDAKVNVFRNYYETITKEKITNAQARTIGRNMEINGFANTYLYKCSETNEPAISVQRFKEKKTIQKK